MGIIYNNKNIDNVTYNGNSIDTVNYNNTEVFTSGNKLTIDIGIKDNTNIVSNITVNNIDYWRNYLPISIKITPGQVVTISASLMDVDDIHRGVFNWSGYTTETNQEFTFIMPDEDITYIANGYYEFYIPDNGYISEKHLLYMINNNIYDSNLIGRQFQLKEGSGTGTWWIIDVGTGSSSTTRYYDLWAGRSVALSVLGYHSTYSTSTKISYLETSETDTNYVRGFCNNFINRLSSFIQDYVKPGINPQAGNDRICVLSPNQIFDAVNSVWKDSSISMIPFFSKTRSDGRIGRYVIPYDFENCYYYTSSCINTSGGICVAKVNSNNMVDEHSNQYYGNVGRGGGMIVPAMRMGRYY